MNKNKDLSPEKIQHKLIMQRFKFLIEQLMEGHERLKNCPKMTEEAANTWYRDTALDWQNRLAMFIHDIMTYRVKESNDESK